MHWGSWTLTGKRAEEKEAVLACWLGWKGWGEQLAHLNSCPTDPRGLFIEQRQSWRETKRARDRDRCGRDEEL